MLYFDTHIILLLNNLTHRTCHLDNNALGSFQKSNALLRRTLESDNGAFQLTMPAILLLMQIAMAFTLVHLAMHSIIRML